ncbi:MAG: hypothetical protein JWP63_2470, partial [Candidatus Solibacter sp.]|nr:hypothetical protein [Candidatus Solibacter sp.]
MRLVLCVPAIPLLSCSLLKMPAAEARPP